MKQRIFCSVHQPGLPLKVVREASSNKNEDRYILPCPECIDDAIKNERDRQTKYGPWPLTNAEVEVLNERQRQIDSEGYDERHDSRHYPDQLAMAAVAYLLADEEYSFPDNGDSYSGRFWPWGYLSFKPKDKRRNIVRAAALLIAELDKMDNDAEAEKSIDEHLDEQSIAYAYHIEQLKREAEKE